MPRLRELFLNRRIAMYYSGPFDVQPILEAGIKLGTSSARRTGWALRPTASARSILPESRFIALLAFKRSPTPPSLPAIPH